MAVRAVPADFRMFQAGQQTRQLPWPPSTRFWGSDRDNPPTGGDRRVTSCPDKTVVPTDLARPVLIAVAVFLSNPAVQIQAQFRRPLGLLAQANYSSRLSHAWGAQQLQVPALQSPPGREAARQPTRVTRAMPRRRIRHRRPLAGRRANSPKFSEAPYRGSFLFVHVEDRVQLGDLQQVFHPLVQP